MSTRCFKFISPHYDDAVLSCGGLISRLCQQGIVCEIITVFGGGPTFDYQLSPVAQQYVAEDLAQSDTTISIALCWELIKLRRIEDANAAKYLGQIKLNSYLYPDGIYRSNHSQNYYKTEEDLFGVPNKEDALSLMEDVHHRFLQCEDSANAYWFFPALSQHVDHQIIHQIGMRMAEYGFNVIFYEEFPYWQSAQAFSLPGYKLHVLSIVDQIANKLNAVFAYQSQLTGLFGGEKQIQQALQNKSLLPNIEKYWLNNLLFLWENREYCENDKK